MIKIIKIGAGILLVGLIIILLQNFHGTPDRNCVNPEGIVEKLFFSMCPEKENHGALPHQIMVKKNIVSNYEGVEYE